VPFLEYLIDHFAPSADGFMMWVADPGYCCCDQCFPGYVPYLEARDEIAQMIGGRARLHLSLWLAEQLENGPEQIPATPGLRAAILKAIDPQDFVMLWAEEAGTVAAARERGVPIVPLFFRLDPESGNESANILPRPRIAAVEEELQQARERGDAGQFGYRLTPYTQWPTDWLFLQRWAGCTEPAQEVFMRLGARLGLADRAGDFVDAIMALDSFWTEGDPRHAALLDEIGVMPIFQGLGLDYLWQQNRALPFLQMRLRWFAQAVGPALESSDS